MKLTRYIDLDEFKKQEITVENVRPGMVFQDNYSSPTGWSTEWLYVLKVRKRKGGGRIFYVINQDQEAFVLRYDANEKVLPRPDKLACFK